MIWVRLKSARAAAFASPLVEVDDNDARKLLKLWETRAYKTYRSRESACVRLGQRARAWNWALIALSTATTVAAIGMLSAPLMYGPNGSALLVCVSVLTLVVSLAATNMDYSGRSRDMFLNYRKLQRLAVEMEELGRSKIVTRSAMELLADRYQAVLDESENHTSGDYFKNFSNKYEASHPLYLKEDGFSVRDRFQILRDLAITWFPYTTLLLPLFLLIPLVKSLIP